MVQLQLEFEVIVTVAHAGHHDHHDRRPRTGRRPCQARAFRPAGVRAESAAGLTQESLPRWRYCIMIGNPAAVPGVQAGRGPSLPLPVD